MAGEAPEYVRRVKALPCAVGHRGGCSGGVEAHHAGPRPGLGLKAPDDTCVPLCGQHHRDYHAAAGPFRGLRRAERERWASDAILATRLRLDAPSAPDWF